MQAPGLDAFLAHALSQKAASLLIARAPERAIRALEAEGFSNLQNPNDLAAPGKHYVWVSADNAKEAYDLAIQYGTGQISMHDERTHQPLWVNPHYQDAAIVLVIDKEALLSVEQSGLPLRAAAGLAFQLA